MPTEEPSRTELDRQRRRVLEMLHRVGTWDGTESEDEYDTAEAITAERLRTGAAPTLPTPAGWWILRIDCDRITDWDSFHDVFAEEFGFPAFYGRNMNAWIDCVGYLDEPTAGMTSIAVPPGRTLTLELDGVTAFAARCPEQYAALVEGVAFVNWRRAEAGRWALLALAFYKAP